MFLTSLSSSYRLLSLVAIQQNIHVVDVTAEAALRKQKTASSSAATATAVVTVKTTTAAAALPTQQHHNLPKGLTQEELHVPTDEKDIYAYYYLTKVLTVK